MTDAERKIAKKRVKARRDFWSTTVVLVVVEILLIAVWYVSSGGRGTYFWPLWPALGFAVAIVFSGLNAFGVLNRDVTETDIDAELDRMKRKG